MRRISRIERRSLLTGWIKWALLPAIPFSIFFFDAWLNVQVRYKDYELSQLNAARRELNVELDNVRASEARISGVEHLTEMAERLQLASPGSQQFKTVAYQETVRRIPVMNLAQEVAPSSHPIIINLEEKSPVALAKKVSPAPVVAPVADVVSPEQVVAAPHSEIVSEMLIGNEVAAQTGDILVQPAAMIQNNNYNDAELTVEDMLGRL